MVVFATISMWLTHMFMSCITCAYHGTPNYTQACTYICDFTCLWVEQCRLPVKPCRINPLHLLKNPQGTRAGPPWSVCKHCLADYTLFPKYFLFIDSDLYSAVKFFSFLCLLYCTVLYEHWRENKIVLSKLHMWCWNKLFWKIHF